MLHFGPFGFFSGLFRLTTTCAIVFGGVFVSLAGDPTADLKEPSTAIEEVDNSEAVQDENAKPQGNSVGAPLAPGIIDLLYDEMVSGLKQRGIEQQFSRFRNYARRKLDTTSGRYSGSEVAGNCRLSWYDYLLRNPLRSPKEAEQFTRKLHESILDEHFGLDGALSIACEKLDLDGPGPRRFEVADTPQKAIDTIKMALAETQIEYAKALSTLSPREVNELSRDLYPTLTTRSRHGHTLDHRAGGRRLCDLLEKLDRSAMHAAARALTPITDTSLLEQLAKLPTDGKISVDGVKGDVLERINTPSGDILICGNGENEYDLERVSDVAVVIDLGGDDYYKEGTVSVSRQVLILIDLGGNDRYRGEKPGIQGSAILGISMLLDAAGDDVYQAQNLAQGSCLGGAGMLIDYKGDDQYIAVRRAQGEAIGGVGLLIDRGGDDSYHAAMWAQGFGGPVGFGLLDDLAGNDHYYAGGLYLDSYDETPGYEGWSQGSGAGLRQVANGGIGVILDGGGDDVYEYDYLAHGCGYWLGVGFARDFGGNDQRLGATRTAYNGGARGERQFQRFSNGLGCHYALGFCFDDAGNDRYHGTIMGLGFAWDVAVGVICDFAGDDQYTSTGSTTQGHGAQAGLGVIFDYKGNDVYRGYSQGRAVHSISYHSLPECGGNFGFVVDYGGKDRYGCGARNDSYNRRGSSGGFLIDRPSVEDLEETAEQGKKTVGRLSTNVTTK